MDIAHYLVYKIYHIFFFSFSLFQHIEFKCSTFKNTKMSLETSQAAISAIVVLQTRIKELEAEKIALQKNIESLRIQIESKNNEITENETNLMNATSKARQMIDNASIVIGQIRNARNENQALKENIAQCELHLYNMKESPQVSREQEIYKRNLIRRNLEQYQKLLNEIFATIQENHFGRYLSAADIRKINLDPDLLPQPIRDVVHRLRKLPIRYGNEPVATKRAIVQGLIRSIELGNEIVAKIKVLQRSLAITKTPRRIQFEIKTHAVHLYVLTHEIRRFDFS